MNFELSIINWPKASVFLYSCLLVFPFSFPLGATGVFREATEYGFGPTKGSEFPFATVVC